MREYSFFHAGTTFWGKIIADARGRIFYVTSVPRTAANTAVYDLFYAQFVVFNTTNPIYETLDTLIAKAVIVGGKIADTTGKQTSGSGDNFLTGLN